MEVSRQVRRQAERAAQKAARSRGKAHVQRVGAAQQVAKTFPEEKIDAKAEKLVAVAFMRDGETYHGWKSHSDLRRSIGDQDPYRPQPQDIAGFWTDRDRFVTRREAVPIAVAAGQISKDWLNVHRELLSSDVW